VTVKGIDDVLVRLARCCNPVPGDAIVGFVTRGRGVSVHREDCPNAKDLVAQHERIIDVGWDESHATTYQVEILIEALDRTHLLHEISSVLAETGVNILAANVTTDRHGISTMRFLFELGNMERLPGLLAEVRAIEGVFDANRMMPQPANGKKKGAKR
jgi:GTP pyrophosphokinase